MNNKGFAITGIIYGIFVLFVLTLIGLLALFNSRRAVLDELKHKVLGDVTVKIDLSPITYTANTIELPYYEFTAQARGYYQIELTSGKMGSNIGKTLTTEIYLKKGETLYFIVGSSNYNSGNTEIRTNPNNSSTVIARSSSLSTSIYLPEKFEDRDFINTEINNNISNGRAKITYLSREKENPDLNKVRYIKDCIDGNSKDDGNHWVEIKAIVDGVNKAYQKSVTGNVDDYSLITDGIVDSSKYASSSSNGSQCVTIDLETPYNIDQIIIWHYYEDSRTYYNNVVSTSLDGVNYTPVHVIEKKETSIGNVISSYEESNVMLVGNVYVPVKTFDDAKWVRVFHHNNRNGTVFWNALTQASKQGGYDQKHKQSILYNLEEFKNNKGEFEFLLEYSELTGYNRWIQESNPVTIKDYEVVNGYNSNYEKANIDFDTNGWNGLCKSNSGVTLIDGSPGSDKYYSIGAVSTAKWNNGIRGPSSTSIKDSVDLWVRIDNLE